jgi:hypothetical protein
LAAAFAAHSRAMDVIDQDLYPGALSMARVS